MANVKIQGNASGSGVLTITAPNTDSTRTITLPDSTGTLLDTTNGGLQLLSTQTISGNAASVIFTGLSSTYDHYMIFMDNVTG